MASTATLKNGGRAIEVVRAEGGSAQVYPIDLISSTIETASDGSRTARLFFGVNPDRVEIIAVSNNPSSPAYGNTVLGSGDPVDAAAAIGSSGSSGGGSGGSGGSIDAATVRDGIDTSADIDLIKTNITAIKTSVDQIGVADGIDASIDIDLIKTSLASILAELVNSRGLGEQWVQDSSATPIKMLRRVSVDQTTGAITVSYVDGSPAQNAVMPVLPVTPIGVSRAALTPVTYQLNNGATVFDGYLDELSTPTALYTDLLRQAQVTIGSAPTNALGTSIKAVDPGPKTSRLADVRDGIDASADIGTIIAALNAIKGSTDLIDVAGGINNSTDIGAISAELAAIKAAVGGTRQFDRQWVEDSAGNLLLQVSNLSAADAGITTIYMDLGGAIAVPSGAVRPVRIGRASEPAPSWNPLLSDSEWMRRFYRLMAPAPGTIFRSTVTAVNAGNTDMTGLGLPSTQRLVITRILIQSLSDVRNTAVLRSIGTTSSNLESYRLAGDGSGVSEVRAPHTFIRGAAGANISINLAVAAPGGVYAQIQWYLEDVVTGLPVV